MAWVETEEKEARGNSGRGWLIVQPRKEVRSEGKNCWKGKKKEERKRNANTRKRADWWTWDHARRAHGRQLRMRNEGGSLGRSRNCCPAACGDLKSVRKCCCSTAWPPSFAVSSSLHWSRGRLPRHSEPLQSARGTFVAMDLKESWVRRTTERLMAEQSSTLQPFISLCVSTLSAAGA